MKNLIILLTVGLIHLNLFSFGQVEQITLKSDENLSIVHSNQGISKDWITISLTVSKHGGFFSMHGANFDVQVARPIEHCYKYDKDYFGFHFDLDGVVCFYLFSFVHNTGYLVVDPESKLKRSIELYKMKVVKDSNDSTISLDSFLPLLKLLF